MFQKLFKNRKGFIASIFYFGIFSLISAISVFLFVWFFKYHVTVYISNDAQKSKAMLVPLVLTTMDFGDDSFALAFNKLDNNIKSTNFAQKVDDLIKKYYLTNSRGAPENTLCYQLNIIERKNGFDSLSFQIPDIVIKMPQSPVTKTLKCEKNVFTRMEFPVPTVFDRVGVTKKIELKTYKMVAT